MAGGYDFSRTGESGVIRTLRSLQRQIDALRSGAGIRSAVVRGEQFTFQDPDGNDTAIIGEDNNVRGLKVFVGDTVATIFEWLAGSGLSGTGFQVGFPDAGPKIDGAWIYATLISLEAPTLRLDSVPTTGLAANLVLDTASSNQVKRSTSSERYKEQFEPVTVDPAELLQVAPTSWIHSGEYEGDVAAAKRVADAAPSRPDGKAAERSKPKKVRQRRYVGFRAEDLDQHPTLRQFVQYDDQGRADAIDYDRLTVALLELAKAQQARIDGIEERLASLEARK